MQQDDNQDNNQDNNQDDNVAPAELYVA